MTNRSLNEQTGCYFGWAGSLAKAAKIIVSGVNASVNFLYQTIHSGLTGWLHVAH